MSSNPADEKLAAKIKDLELKLAAYEKGAAPQLISEEFQRLANRSRDMIYRYDLTTRRFVFVNKTGLEFYGIDVEGGRGVTAKSVLISVYPEDRDTVKKAQKESLALGSMGGEAEYRQIRPDGSLHWMHDRWIIITDETGNPVTIEGIVRDITDRKLAVENLEKERQEFKLIIDSSPIIIFYKDKKGRFVRVNKIFAEMLKLPKEEFVGKTVFDLYSAKIAQGMTNDDQEVIKSGHPKLNIIEQYESASGIKWVQTDKIPICDKNGTPFGLIGFAQDITERKRAEEELQRTLESLRKAVGATIQVMVSAVETRDPYTAGHQIRSADLARAIATEMGLPQDKIDGIRVAGSIHDIGKLSIPSEILSKPTKLSEIEFALIKEHARQGFEVLKGVESLWPLAEIIHQHHERMDGSGYPRNLIGEEILIEARILAVADVVEAMASHRPYRPGLGIDLALAEIEKNRGIFYDNTVADACLRLFREKGFQLAGT